MSDEGSVPDGSIVVFLLTDIEGSTRRWEAGPETMSKALARHDAVVAGAIAEQRGQVFKTLGDGFFAAFTTPGSAIAAALAIQRAMADSESTAMERLAVRIAIHAGPAERRGADFFGPGLNRAARLLELAYGGQVLISGAAADMARGYMPAQSSLMDLGPHRLRDIREPEHIYQLIAPGLRAAFPSLPSRDAVIHNVPRQLTPFIGRRTELAEMRSRLERHKLVTLVGPGGSGKTRVAVEIASEFLKEAFEMVCFADLSAIHDSRLVAETLCSTMGVPVSGSQSATDSAVGYLARRRAHIVLDNCEHLVDAVAHLVDTLLRACPSLLALATSRERLGVQGEYVHVLGSLSMPPPASALTATEALAYDSVKLFEERASAVVDGFAITDVNATAVASICRQLDGLPLAIELVVPQLRAMQLPALASRLSERLLAARGDRTALPRHQTLQALFDWSYNLLNTNERRLFARLTVFAGGWSLAAASAVAADPAETEQDMLELLAVLIDKSLVIVDRRLDEARFSLLQPVHDYARRHLPEDEEALLRARHATFMLALAREAYASWPTSPTDTWRSRYEPELDNVRQALDWAFGPRGDRRVGLELCGYAARIWDELSLFSERERWIAKAFGDLDPALDGGAMARLWLGRLSTSAQGDRTNLEPALAAAKLFRMAGDGVGLGEALAKAGAALLLPESIDDAMPYLDEALEVMRAAPPSKHLAACLRSHGIARYFVSDFEGARALIARSDATARKLSDKRGRRAAQIAAAELEFAAGDGDKAIAITRALLDAREAGHRHTILAQTNLAAYLVAADRVAEAREAARAALRHARSLGWRAAMARAIEHLALCATLDGEKTLARRLFQCTIAFYATEGASREFTELATYNRLTAAFPDLAGESARASTDAEAWTLDEASDAALAS